MLRLSAFPLLALLSACASVVGGTTQPITVDTTPVSEARCDLTNDKGTFVVPNTPASVVVARSIEDLVVNCSKAGYRAPPNRIVSKTKALAFGNIIAGGLVGAAVDRTTGAAFDFPEFIHVTLTPIEPSPDSKVAPTLVSPETSTAPTRTVDATDVNRSPVDDRRPALARLRELQSLRTEGGITEEEFLRRRKSIVQTD